MNSFSSTTLILLSICLGLFVAKPKWIEIQDLSLKKSGHEETLSQLKSLEELRQNLERKFEAISPESKEKIRLLLPTTAGTVKLISDINAITSKYGATIENVSYKSITNNSQSLSEATNQKPYNSTSVSFGLTSDYNKFRSILSDLESSLRIIDVRDVSILANKSGQNTYKIDVEVYWMP